jgi:Holliday junction resolvasome RuvABC ATP-dependent DNA helicase subunit
MLTGRACGLLLIARELSEAVGLPAALRWRGASGVVVVASVEGVEAVDAATADRALQRLEVDAMGLDALDRRYMLLIARNFGGGPVGIETIAAALSEPRDAIEEIVEPFLLQQGFIQRTPRGRMATQFAYRHFGLKMSTDPAVRSGGPDSDLFSAQ